MPNSVTQERFVFQSEGVEVVGNLFLPEEQAAGVAIVTGPLTSVKEQAAGTYAQAMAKRGYAALAFDYRFFGESGGQPRQFESPQENIKDIQNAVSSLSADSRFKGLPALGLGVCFGAGPMARAVAGDSRFSAFAGVAGVYSSQAETKKLMGEAYQQAIDRGRAAQRAWQETGKAETIPAVAPDGGDVAMPLREAYEFYGTPRGIVPNYVNGFAVQSWAYTVPFDALGTAETMGVPVVIVHSEKALQPNLAHAFYASAHPPKDELWLDSQGQIDFYDDPKLINAATDKIVAFLQANVQA